ncbi:hypothetical protein GALMADRAFT_270443 [Galerina marginata CBS 339.88]|uniref:ER transporter 6TM N-terminal domain-containing protein n=1 Tax=Galerina marginata (strain CBS 339.88) TaxID=685588 RepID=A0A067SZG4_GALM3|nr:hypothetical protein GALMADRAFT_270443 [Galerina marginata CBS 339.88]
MSEAATDSDAPAANSKTAASEKGTKKPQTNGSPSNSVSHNSSKGPNDAAPNNEDRWITKGWSGVRSYFARQFAWVPQNFEWSKIKLVVRCALAAWVSVVLFIIPKVERVMGQAPFLILIAIFLSPPSDPFVAIAEREFFVLLLAAVSWAWCCLGIFLANLTRNEHMPTATLAEVIDAKYIEAAPSVIIGFFIFSGTAMLLWIRARQGLGPMYYPCILACLGIEIILPASALFPFPYYRLGRSVLVPLSFHTAISLLSCIFIFPSTITTLFTCRLSASLAPLLSALNHHRTLLAISLSSPNFASLLATVREDTKGFEAALVPLTATARLLGSDLTYGRFSPTDFVAFQAKCRRLAGRADGLGRYFTLVDPMRERFLGTATTTTPVKTAPGTPRMNSRVMLVGEQDAEQNGTMGAPLPNTTPNLQVSASQMPRPQPLSQVSSGAPSASVFPTAHSAHAKAQAHSVAPSHLRLHGGRESSSTLPTEPRRHQHRHSENHVHGLHHRLLHSSLASVAHARTKKPEYAVGTFESQRYLNLEATGLRDPLEEHCNEKIEVLLKTSCEPLLGACILGISTTTEWLSGVRGARFPEVLSSIGLLPPSPTADRSRIPGACAILDLIGIGQKKRRNERKKREERVTSIREVRTKIANELDKFRAVDRHAVLEPYLPAFEEPENSSQNQTLFPWPFCTGASQPQTPPKDNAEETLQSGLDDHIRKGESPKDEKAEHDFLSRKEEGDPTIKSEYFIPPHRCLFNCYVYQYNLMQIASVIVEMLDEVIGLEESRTECRLWTPAERLFRWRSWSLPKMAEPDEDEDDNPDIIEGMQNSGADTPPPPSTRRTNGSTPFPDQPTTDSYLPTKATGPAFPVDPNSDLGLPRRRDPDALPPSNLFESLMHVIHEFILSFRSGNVLFALKGGLLALALSLPSLIKHSAAFAYENRFIWAIFFGQMTLQRFRGDTAFALFARIISTFFGALTGMVMWYMSCGSGQGNAYGLAAVCAGFFPFFFYGRLYWPVPLLCNFVFFVTASLVIGYSYQDYLLKLPGNPGAGFSVAWRRFVLVTCGVVAAGIASFFPPSTTIRRYQRRLLSTTSAELGTLYCEILSFANTKHVSEVQEIISGLLAVRSKLARGEKLRLNVMYEYSLKGKWPKDRYQRIMELQLGLSHSLSHLMSVLSHLEPSWSRAFLRRTRFMDPEFQGDVLAVISMISFSLRTGCPLPQITPCPLMDRFLLRYHGLNIVHEDAEEDYGLPRKLSVETLKDEQYLMFSVGIAGACGIVTRLDGLMVAVKEVVGERYHIHGVGAGGWGGGRTRLPSRVVPGFVPPPLGVDHV